LEHFDGGLKEPAVPMVDHIVYMHINISLKKMMHFHKLEQQLLEKKNTANQLCGSSLPADMFM